MYSIICVSTVHDIVLSVICGSRLRVSKLHHTYMYSSSYIKDDERHVISAAECVTPVVTIQVSMRTAAMM